jgi:hypothetical protein
VNCGRPVKECKDQRNDEEDAEPSAHDAEGTADAAEGKKKRPAVFGAPL